VPAVVLTISVPLLLLIVLSAAPVVLPNAAVEPVIAEQLVLEENYKLEIPASNAVCPFSVPNSTISNI
jgi:hypothetical protein